MKEKGKPVPEVYEYVKIDERPSLIMERLYGNTMLDEMNKKPLKLFKEAENFAKLQMQILDSAEGLGMISKKYLSACKKLYDFDWGEFSKWMVVRAAERVFYGQIVEKEGLIKFIKECMKAQALGTETKDWWHFL